MTKYMLLLSLAAFTSACVSGDDDLDAMADDSEEEIGADTAAIMGGGPMTSPLVPFCTDTASCAPLTADVLAEFNNDLVGAYAGGAGTELQYCLPGTLECRSLLLQDGAFGFGQPRAAFVDNFVSSRRFAAAVAYFLPNQDGTYRAALDATFDGQVNVNLAWTENQALHVSYNPWGLPTIHNLVLKELGTTRYAVATLKFRFTRAVLKGHVYDENDPNFSVELERVYYRVNP